MDRAGVLERSLAEFLSVSKIVVIASEARLAIDAALHDVLRHAGKVESWEPRHGAYPDGGAHDGPALRYFAVRQPRAESQK
ncbi:hypothetical protein GCM10007067_15170 [Lysobacter bugurensis]|uniref:Uncharacterized protein n=1 Tax=Cognatilysobacter bugurensis TaxID=543356 RepID=A0A918SY77_9GAMM|nr:hypothetical protein GCM10007067_15170 [Lysobacter bugurensis]